MKKIIVQGDVKRLSQVLTDFANKDPETYRAADTVRMLMPQIQQVMARGHDAEKVLKLLAEHHEVFADMSISTFRTYLRRSKTAVPTAKKASSHKSQNTTPMSPAQFAPHPTASRSASAEARSEPIPVSPAPAAETRSVPTSAPPTRPAACAHADLREEM